MDYSDLYTMIKYLEYGTKLHIGVVFLGYNGNSKCLLPQEHTIHVCPVCDLFKTGQNNFRRCFRCRNYAFNKAIASRKKFGGLCINGVYEYVRPVTVNDKVICLIYIGNILTDEGKKKLSDKAVDKEIPFDTMEKDFGFEKCDEAAGLLESYIVTLLEKHEDEQPISNILVRNIRDYINSNYQYSLSVRDIAKFFSYNEAYLGRLFKEEAGCSIKEYINDLRLKKAAELLKKGLTVISASQQAGFDTVTYFNRIFKNRYGITPGDYKRQYS